MTVTERERRRMELVDGGAHRTDLCEQLAMREYELDNLKDENAKLREELADAPKCEACEAMLDCDECLRADGSHKERRRLSIENAKLRELARGLGQCAQGVDCEDCLLHDLSEPDHCREERLSRELGIEVPNAD